MLTFNGRAEEEALERAEIERKESEIKGNWHFGTQSSMEAKGRKAFEKQ